MINNLRNRLKRYTYETVPDDKNSDSRGQAAVLIPVTVSLSPPTSKVAPFPAYVHAVALLLGGGTMGESLTSGVLHRSAVWETKGWVDNEANVRMWMSIKSVCARPPMTIK